MSSLTGIVIFLMILNGTLPFVNSFALDGSTQFSYARNVNITGIESAAACSTYTNGTINCDVDMGDVGILSQMITFGNFLWSAAKMVALLPVTVGIAYTVLVQNFYAPVEFAAIINLAIWALLVFWLNALISGRYIFEVE